MTNTELFKQLEVLAQMVPAPFYWLDKSGIIVGANQLWLSEIGAPSKHSICGKMLRQVYKNKDIVGALEEDIRWVLKTGRKSKTENSVVDTITGRVRYYSVVRSPIKNPSGEVIGVIGTSIEVTAKKELEKIKLQQLESDAKSDVKKVFSQCITQISNIISQVQVNFINAEIGRNGVGDLALDKPIKLTRREQEVIYFLSMGKSPKEIANIISSRENKSISHYTISSIICKKLYIKLEVFSIGQLVERAKLLHLVPFIPDSFLKNT
jgi:PAS domain S-box-containing protein